MIKERIKIVNELGLHARAASKLVTLASKYRSETKLSLENGIGANCKSIMGLMMLGASCGTEMFLYADGGDEAEAFDAVKSLIDDGFGEKG